jgi:hypothetical protein
VVVVLAGMDDDLFEARDCTSAMNGRELRKVGSCPNEVKQFDGIGPQKTLNDCNRPRLV